LKELVEFASTCCLMDKGIMLRNAIENNYTLIVDVNCSSFLNYFILNSNDSQIKQYFQHFLNEDNNSMLFLRDVNKEEVQSIQNENNESNRENFIFSEEAKSNESESERFDVETPTTTFSNS
jgi:hypothetical protein